jgi:hypothetical protein
LVNVRPVSAPPAAPEGSPDASDRNNTWHSTMDEN